MIAQKELRQKPHFADLFCSSFWDVFVCSRTNPCAILFDFAHVSPFLEVRGAHALATPPPWSGKDDVFEERGMASVCGPGDERRPERRPGRFPKIPGTSHFGGNDGQAVVLRSVARPPAASENVRERCARRSCA